MRLTPLNIVSAILITSVAYLQINADASGWRLLGSVPLLILTAICFVSDLLFRRFLVKLKRIWIIESVFIIFVLLLIIIIQKI